MSENWLFELRERAEHVMDNNEDLSMVLYAQGAYDILGFLMMNPTQDIWEGRIDRLTGEPLTKGAVAGHASQLAEILFAGLDDDE